MTIHPHLREIAEESGLDLDEALCQTHRALHPIPGTDQVAETYWQQSAIFQPIRAFLLGVGEASGWDVEDALENLAKKARPIIAAGRPVGLDYLASIGTPDIHIQPSLPGLERVPVPLPPSILDAAFA